VRIHPHRSKPTDIPFSRVFLEHHLGAGLSGGERRILDQTSPYAGSDVICRAGTSTNPPSEVFRQSRMPAIENTGDREWVQSRIGATENDAPRGSSSVVCEEPMGSECSVSERGAPAVRASPSGRARSSGGARRELRCRDRVAESVWRAAGLFDPDRWSQEIHCSASCSRASWWLRRRRVMCSLSSREELPLG